MTFRPYTSLVLFSLAYTLLLLCGCTSLLTNTIIKPTVGNLQRQPDVELVCDGSPAYLLMIDSLIESAPDSRQLLLLATQSYTGSIAALESCGTGPTRLLALSEKAGNYGKRLLQKVLPATTGTHPENELTGQLDSCTKTDAPYLFWGCSGWLAWIGQQQGSPAAMADLVVIEAVMKRILELDETVEHGGAHLFFGVLLGTKPILAGGDPEQSRKHFERALELSNHSLLMVQTMYAQTYARMTFDKDLHNRLLQEVVAFPVETVPEQMLFNQIAKRKARQLLAEDYFAE